MTHDQYQAMRFQAACSAMSGVIANQVTFKSIFNTAEDKNLSTEEVSAYYALFYADALLKELGIEEPKE